MPLHMEDTWWARAAREEEWGLQDGPGRWLAEAFPRRGPRHGPRRGGTRGVARGRGTARAAAERSRAEPSPDR